MEVLGNIFLVFLLVLAAILLACLTAIVVKTTLGILRDK